MNINWCVKGVGSLVITYLLIDVLYSSVVNNIVSELRLLKYSECSREFIHGCK